MNSQKLMKGNLLVAELSSIGDVSFNRSVVLLADHNQEGSVGFILNKPLHYTLTELIPDLTAHFTVFNGGPVEQDNLYFIHTVPELIPNSIEISNGLFWGGDFETIKTLIQEDRLSKNTIRFFLGYTGWSANQLENEVSSNFWILLSNTYGSKILTKLVDAFWKEKIIEMGGDYLLWSNAPENPILN